MASEALFFFFFFSSRRRHTRFSRDWSSDVCSSDLEVVLREDRLSRVLQGSRFVRSVRIDFELVRNVTPVFAKDLGLADTGDAQLRNAGADRNRPGIGVVRHGGIAAHVLPGPLEQ